MAPIGLVTAAIELAAVDDPADTSVIMSLIFIVLFILADGPVHSDGSF